MSSNSNPVFSDGNKWYFWDETWTQFLGPYDSESEADEAAKEYASYLDTGYYPDSLQTKKWKYGQELS